MQHCHDEHAAVGDHDHNHDHDDEVEDANGDSLYPFIDTSKLRVLNALDPQAAAHPFKPFHERQDHSRFLASNDDDPEMILFIPFTEAVSIKSICISGSAGDGTHPKEVKLFTNRDDIDFSNANELPAQQKLALVEDDTANIDYPLQVRKFQGVSSVTLFIENSYGGDETKIYYIGLKGESKKWRHGVVECVYEARPQPTDHKIKDTIGSTSLI
ncbi:PITH domain-containing protein 1 [Phytophthora pseudosyringae]|uniref:PITH domain-containing protein 1 n=1 Tax=Phytophthora pseudosyringae TaxID=221518 RepID=A0A8T1VD82_9STRA|nr:PITH domain-containing protein 1 [Phytophthora pseudosyringae]